MVPARTKVMVRVLVGGLGMEGVLVRHRKHHKVAVDLVFLAGGSDSKVALVVRYCRLDELGNSALISVLARRFMWMG